MVRRPKTLPAEATVADARKALEYERVKLLLLVDGDRFVATVSAVPSGAEPHEPAMTYADADPPMVAGDASVGRALELLEHRPNGRLVVVDDEQTLLGLVCLTSDGTEFCGVT